MAKTTSRILSALLFLFGVQQYGYADESLTKVSVVGRTGSVGSYTADRLAISARELGLAITWVRGTDPAPESKYTLELLRYDDSVYTQIGGGRKVAIDVKLTETSTDKVFLVEEFSDWSWEPLVSGSHGAVQAAQEEALEDALEAAAAIIKAR